ncbi:putative SERF-like protein [Ctenocephalides felis]|uniref:putative SERF-like protein n=1 Tax=Ctenocephalides felis TaxID=7515 RepID=UPI000E6E369A|nr:putative SERF-like protein [Ctenocephalides felis]
MTRGNQRDLARAKNQKKQAELAKKKSSTDKNGMTFEQRKHRDAELMREKQRKKEQEAAAASSNS